MSHSEHVGSEDSLALSCWHEGLASELRSHACTALSPAGFVSVTMFVWYSCQKEFSGGRMSSHSQFTHPGNTCFQDPRLRLLQGLVLQIGMLGSSEVECAPAARQDVQCPWPNCRDVQIF